MFPLIHRSTGAALVAGIVFVAGCSFMSPHGNNSPPAPLLDPAGVQAIDDAIASIIVRQQMPGAVFWMWAIAFVGAGSAYIESALSQVWKEEVHGEYRGGPAYYMEKGLKSRPLGIAFALLTVFGCGLALPGIQTNAFAQAASHSLQEVLVPKNERCCRCGGSISGKPFCCRTCSDNNHR